MSKIMKNEKLVQIIKSTVIVRKYLQNCTMDFLVKQIMKEMDSDDIIHYANMINAGEV